MSVNKQIKGSMQGYKIDGRNVTRVRVKSNKTDAGGNFYTYDLFDNKDGTRLAKNRYVYKNSESQLFDELTEAEELILTPPVVINEEEEVI